MKRKLRLSTLIVLAVLMLSLLIGGLYGYFDDTETSNGNVFTAGTLNLVATDNGTGPAGKYAVTAGGDGINGFVTFDRVAPGDSGSISWTLTNDGNLDGLLTLVCTDNVFTENSSNEPELALGIGNNDVGGNGDLDENMLCQLSVDGNYVTNGGFAGYVPFSDLAAALNSQADLALDASSSTVYLLEWQIDTTVGNIIQSDTATIGITFTLDQV
jgi:spore coat-associated protein N